MHPPLLDDVPPLDTVADMTKAIAEVEAHLTRADTNKAPLGFGAATFVGTGVFTAASQFGSPAWVWGALAAGVGLPIVVALLLTIAAWLPRLDGGHGFAVYAKASSREELLRMLAAEQAEPYHRLVWSSRLALGKYQLIRAAGVLTAAAVVAAATVGAAALATHLA